MLKSLQLQSELAEEFGACVFDVTLDCEDGAPVGGEADHAALVTRIALEAGVDARVAVRVHPVDHPAFESDMAVIAGQAGHRLTHVMVPKVESLDDVRRAETALVAASADHLPLHVLIESPAAVHRAFEIAAHPRVQSLSFGLMDFVSAHGVRSRHRPCRQAVSSPTHSWCGPSWKLPRPATPTARSRPIAW